MMNVLGMGPQPRWARRTLIATIAVVGITEAAALLHAILG